MTLDTPVTPGRRPGSARPAPQGGRFFTAASLTSCDNAGAFQFALNRPRVGRYPVCCGEA